MTIEIICVCEKVHNVKVQEVPCMLTFICDDCETSELIPIIE